MKRVELVVVGGGPAGLLAAATAASWGVETLVIDENSSSGGRLRHETDVMPEIQGYVGLRGFELVAALQKEVERPGVKVLTEAVAWGLFKDRVLGVARRAHIPSEAENFSLPAKKIILATGAAENPVAFEGWTKPGVLNAWAAQSLLNLYGVLPGRRAVLVGGTDLGRRVAAQLTAAGMEVAAEVEPSSVQAVIGTDRVERVILKDGELQADTVIVAVGLSPVTELGLMAGAVPGCIPQLGGHCLLHDRRMRTTQPGILVAGHAAGVDDIRVLLLTGRIAGLSAASELGKLAEEVSDALIAQAWAEIKAITATSPRWEARQRLVRQREARGDER